MIWSLLLACQAPVTVDWTLLDAVHGEARGGVELAWRTEEARCERVATADADGQLSVELCPGVAYDVVTTAPEVRLWPEVRGVAEALGGTVEVLDRADGVALIGGGTVPLTDAVDVRRVAPKGHEGGLAVPAVLPVVLPTLGARQGLFLPTASASTLQAVPVLPTDTMPLAKGGPLQPWYALGATVDGEGVVEAVPAATPSQRREVPGGVVWTGLPPGTYALWDGTADRVPLLRVE